MNKIIALCSFSLALTTGFNSYAQHASAGFRTGASYWMDHTGKSCFTRSGIEGQNATWDNKVFYRYQGKGNWALDMSMGHYSFSNSGGFKDEVPANSPGYLNTGIREKSRNMEWIISVQYDISCPAMRSGALKKLTSYAGVFLAPTWSRTTTEFTYRKLNDASDISTKSTVNEVNLWAGLSHTMVYDLSPQFNLMSVVSFSMQPDRFFEKHPGASSTPDSRMGLELGVGYKL